MSDEENNSKSSPILYILLVGLLVVIAIAFFLVPFASVGLAIKKTGVLEPRAARESVATKTDTGVTKTDTTMPASDLSGLQADTEKVASNVLIPPKLVPEKNEVQIQVAPPATIETASSKVQDVLSRNNYQFVEAYDNSMIRIIVILKSSQWPELTRMLGEATDLNGFSYHGPSETKTMSNSADTMIASIEITRKPDK